MESFLFNLLFFVIMIDNFINDLWKNSLLYHLDILQEYRSLLWDYHFSHSMFSSSMEETIRNGIINEIPAFRKRAVPYLPRVYLEVLDQRLGELAKDYWHFFYKNSRQSGFA